MDLWGQLGWCGQEVAGESHYADTIRKLFGGDLGHEWSETTTVAQLVPEPTNRHDPNAIQVLINAAVVGYLPKEDAQRYAPVLSGLVSQGWLPQVEARVIGGMVPEYEQDRRGHIKEIRRFAGSVTLDLAEPHMLVPANLPPEDAHVMLPHGGAIQVTGEEAYLSSLSPLVGPAGETWIHVTLHEITEQLARTNRTLIEVRVNGSPAGRLTPKMSGELLPVVRHFADLGLMIGGRAILKGNQLKADVTLHVARSGELSEGWLANPPISAGRTPTRAGAVITAPVTVTDSAVATPSPDAAAVTPTWRFSPPPGWPEPPPGWVPPPGWTPPPGLPAAPEGWKWWQPA
jgi:collagen type III alpha